MLPPFQRSISRVPATQYSVTIHSYQLAVAGPSFFGTIPETALCPAADHAVIAHAVQCKSERQAA